MHYSKAMTSTVDAWVRNKKRKITIYHTDGDMMWVGTKLLGITARNGQKVCIYQSLYKTVQHKAWKYTQLHADLQIRFTMYDADENRKLHALWSMSERLSVDPKTGQTRFHHVLKAAPEITKLNPPPIYSGKKPHTLRYSKVVKYCPKCHGSSGTLVGWKLTLWVKAAEKLGINAYSTSKCALCFSTSLPMTRQGAKLWWLAAKDAWKNNYSSGVPLLDKAIEKGA